MNTENGDILIHIAQLALAGRSLAATQESLIADSAHFVKDMDWRTKASLEHEFRVSHQAARNRAALYRQLIDWIRSVSSVQVPSTPIDMTSIATGVPEDIATAVQEIGDPFRLNMRRIDDLLTQEGQIFRLLEKALKEDIFGLPRPFEEAAKAQPRRVLARIEGWLAEAKRSMLYLVLTGGSLSA